jgi:hypothetical protein
MEKTKLVSGMVMSTLPDANDFDLLSRACKSMKDGSRHCAVSPANKWLCNSYIAWHWFCFLFLFIIFSSKNILIFKLNFIPPLFHVIWNMFIFLLFYFLILLMNVSSNWTTHIPWFGF